MLTTRSFVDFAVKAAFFLLLITLPLQWVRLTSIGSLSISFFHCFSLVLIFLLFFYIKFFLIFIVSNRVFLCVSLMFLFFGVLFQSFFSYRFSSEFLRQLFYFLMAVSVAFYIHHGCFFFRLNFNIFLIFSLLVLFFSILFLGSGVALSSYFESLVLGVTTGNTRIITFKIFRAAMVGSSGNQDVQANLLHYVAGAFYVVSLFVLASVINERASMKAKFIFVTLLLCCFFVIFLTFSRSVLLCVFCSMLIFFAKKFVSGGRLLNKFFIMLAVCLGIALLGYLGFLDLLIAKVFDDTSSYESRTGSTLSILEYIDSISFFFGSGELIANPHNVMLRNWVGGGIVSFFFSLIFICFICYLIFFEMSQTFFKVTSVNNYFHLMLISLLMLPLIRSFTAGSGLASPSWLAIGMYIGFSSNLIKHRKLNFIDSF